MSEQIPQELVDRAIALVRKAAKVQDGVTIIGWEILDEARNLVDQLPAPIDPDLLIAREVASGSIARHSPAMASEIAAGHGDGYSPTKIAYAAIKRIRSENNHG